MGHGRRHPRLSRQPRLSPRRRERLVVEPAGDDDHRGRAGSRPPPPAKWATRGPGPPSAAAPSTRAAMSSRSFRQVGDRLHRLALADDDRALDLASSSRALAAWRPIASARSRASSSIAAWTPPHWTNSCGGTTARMSTRRRSGRRAGRRSAGRRAPRPSRRPPQDRIALGPRPLARDAAPEAAATQARRLRPGGP
jgi:hypothetical protein